jgi:chemotaxis family two-component system sensor kinase Cph1
VNWKDAGGPTQALRGMIVLIVEDEPLIALDLESVLTDEGAVVVGPGANMVESLRLAQSAEVSAALLDVRLGAETVAPVARVLGERGVPFAFYTGQMEADEVRHQWPQAPVIAKPSPARLLVSVLKSLCATPAAPHAACGQ